ncbi:unnamed protein product [Caenorhabditis auriculariae]|uniref:Uncharacterized protein n=1 Tax=Caenorhabditis auriculariae TaxID=2777116 RepID=A0A8S1GQQ3_9PELO|nr:unnamed protein product [Caenorhabditis auriculariae]
MISEVTCLCRPRSGHTAEREHYWPTDWLRRGDSCLPRDGRHHTVRSARQTARVAGGHDVRSVAYAASLTSCLRITNHCTFAI